MQDEDFYMSVSKTYHYMNTCAQIKININYVLNIYYFVVIFVDFDKVRISIVTSILEQK